MQGGAAPPPPRPPPPAPRKQLRQEPWPRWPQAPQNFAQKGVGQVGGPWRPLVLGRSPSTAEGPGFQSGTPPSTTPPHTRRLGSLGI